MRQDLKQTPQKNIPRSHRKRFMDQSICKDLSLPFPQSFCTSHDISSTLTPLRKQPQYLLTPSPIKKDLFSQLLGTELKHYEQEDRNQFIIQQQSMTISDSEQNQISENGMEEEEGQSQVNWSEQSGLKKRKRKSTAQIKLLKQQLDDQANWTKERIAKMADITGLSQSQVYKWFWDQKKKQNKQKIEQQKIVNDKRKMIKKDISYRIHLNPDKSQDQQKENQRDNGNNKMTKTKLKATLNMAQGHETTQKKIKRRLIFF